LARRLELPEDGRGKRIERDTTAASRERGAIVRVIHPRPGRVLAGWVLAVLLPAMTALAKPSPPSSQELESRVEEYITARVKRDHFSGSILIAREGKVLFSKGYVMTNLEHDVPNTPQTKYRLGSITKQFTAMAILILQEQWQAERPRQDQEILA